jgi:light-regulated signal transduction histidine kinase (bacteriophytochrome)
VSSRLSQLNLSLDEIRHLFRITLSAIGSLRHDLTNALGTFGSIVDTIERVGFSHFTPEEEKSLISTCKKAAIRAGKIGTTGLSFTSLFRDFDPFVTDISGMISEIQNLHPDVIFDIFIEEKIKSVHLIYPESALFSIMNGLVDNSEKHGTDKPKVRLTFRMHGNKFVCVVEDNGPGITGAVWGSYLPLDQLDQLYTLLDQREDSVAYGLWEICTIILASEGLLLFGRSNSLGGTEVLVELPILGFWDTNQVKWLRTVS